MPTSTNSPVVVLLGGGVESTSLVDRFLRAGELVVPLHLNCGLIWDAAESHHIRRFLASHAAPNLLPLIELSVPLQDFHSTHWAVTGNDIPGSDDDTARLEIPMRNLTLLGFAAHRMKHLPAIRLAIGTTADNHYTDGSRQYFDRCAELLSMDLGRSVEILTPLIRLTKVDVIRDTTPAILARSFSCVSPIGNDPCGQCIKCGRRRAAFAEARRPDPTAYHFSG